MDEDLRLLLSPEDEERKRLFLEGVAEASLEDYGSPLSPDLYEDASVATPDTVQAGRDYLQGIVENRKQLGADMASQAQALKASASEAKIGPDQAWASTIISVLPFLAGIAAGGRHGAEAGGQAGAKGAATYLEKQEKDAKEKSALDALELKDTRQRYRDALKEERKAELENVREEARVATTDKRLKLTEKLANARLDEASDARRERERLQREKHEFNVEKYKASQEVPRITKTSGSWRPEQQTLVYQSQEGFRNMMTHMGNILEAKKNGTLTQEVLSENVNRMIQAGRQLDHAGSNFTGKEQFFTSAILPIPLTPRDMTSDGVSVEALGKVVQAYSNSDVESKIRRAMKSVTNEYKNMLASRGAYDDRLEYTDDEIFDLGGDPDVYRQARDHYLSNRPSNKKRK